MERSKDFSTGYFFYLLSFYWKTTFWADKWTNLLTIEESFFTLKPYFEPFLYTLEWFIRARLVEVLSGHWKSSFLVMCKTMLNLLTCAGSSLTFDSLQKEELGLSRIEMSGLFLLEWQIWMGISSLLISSDILAKIFSLLLGFDCGLYLLSVVINFRTRDSRLAGILVVLEMSARPTRTGPVVSFLPSRFYLSIKIGSKVCWLLALDWLEEILLAKILFCLIIPI